MPLIVLPATLTHLQSAEFSNSLAEVFKVVAGAPVASNQAGHLAAILDNTIAADAAALTQFDSSALAVLLECRRQALALGRNFMVVNLPARLQQLARLYGVQSLLGLPAGD